MESIVFRWHTNANPESAVEWVTVDADGRPHIAIKTGSLSDLARQVNNSSQKKQPIFLLSADYYSLHQATLPPKLSLANIKKAAPYAIEDELADTIDEYHFACGNIDKNDSATVANIAAINKVTFAKLMSNLAEYNIKPKYAYPESMLLPVNQSQTTIFIEDDVLHTRLDNGLAHTLPLDLLDTVIDDLGNERPIKIISPHELNIDEVNDTPFSMDNIEYELSDKALLSIFAKQLNQHKLINLLQDDFKYQEELGKHIRPWRWPFGLAAAALIVALIGQLLTVNQLDNQNRELEEKKIAIYKEAFPRSRNIDVHSVRSRMKQSIRKLGGSATKHSAFIPLLEQYVSILDNNNNISINDIDYSKEKLSLTLVAQDIQMLDQIKINLEKSKRVIANILSSKTVTNGVEATLKLELL